MCQAESIQPGTIILVVREDRATEHASALLASGTSGTAGSNTEATFGLERFLAPALRLRALRIPALGARAGYVALGAMLLGAVATVLFSTAGNSDVLVPRSHALFPAWESGPLHARLPIPVLGTTALQIGDSVFLLLMALAYGLAIMAARSVSMRVVWIWVIAVGAVLVLGPPLQLTDLFNYLGYARLGALHHLSPYTHGIAAEQWDPVYALTTWHNLPSPYGPLFTAITYPLALMPLPVAYWLLKALIVGASFAFIWLLYKAAKLLGQDPRVVVIFVAANPLYIFYGVGAFHNDFMMLVPAMAAVVLLLARRDRAAGAALTLAIAIKLPVIVLLPFLLIAARPASRRPRFLAGMVLAAIPVGLLDIWLFGFTMPNLSDQSGVVTGFSIPNLTGLALGLGGSTPGILRLANLAVVVVVLMMLRRQREWLAGAGWSMLALLASLAWLTPWYALWLLPLAALGCSVRLRRTTLAFSVFLLLTFLPYTGTAIDQLGINPMSTATGQAALAYQAKLAG